MDELAPDPFLDSVDPVRPHRDFEGNPVSFRQWAMLFEKENRIVAQDRVGDYFLSTIWMGIDHGFGDGPPLIYETMLFKGESSADEECYRYSTWNEAEQNHAKLLAELKLVVEGTT